jgi:hypothetical protein
MYSEYDFLDDFDDPDYPDDHHLDRFDLESQEERALAECLARLDYERAIGYPVTNAEYAAYIGRLTPKFTNDLFPESEDHFDYPEVLPGGFLPGDLLFEEDDSLDP